MDFVPGMEEKYSARGIFSLPDKEFTALATLIGFSLIDHLTATQQNSLGNLFMTIGQILETSAIQQTLLETAARPAPVSYRRKSTRCKSGWTCWRVGAFDPPWAISPTRRFLKTATDRQTRR